ncbi:MAG: ABC transporter ATP-binding protein [Planctomycetota bacterium]
MTSVQVRSLAVSYGATCVLRDVDLEIADGELFFLLGPSGCGKTTLLRTIAGFVEPVSGDISFDGRSVAAVPPARRDCGMVFQNYALWPHLTVRQNVAFGLDVRKVNAEEKRERVAEALRLVKMEEYADRTPNRLSGGQQQRVALARALVVRPAVLLLDEPLSNLDAALRVELRGEIRDIQRSTQRTAVYVTHDRAEALALADRIAVLRNGRIEQVGKPEDLYDRPATPFVAGFVGDANRIGCKAIGPSEGGFRVEAAFGFLHGRCPAGRPGDGERALALVRPERLALLSMDDGTSDDLEGRVRRRTFLGELVQHEVELAEGNLLRALNLGGQQEFPEGAKVKVRVEDALVYPDESDGKG